MRDDTGEVEVTGARYGENFVGTGRDLPLFRAFVEERLGVDVACVAPAPGSAACLCVYPCVGGQTGGGIA